MSENTPLLSLRGIERDYGSGENKTRALHSINLDVAEGEFLAIIGPSGSGKSTLLNILGLLDAPTAGTLSIEGLNVETLNERERDRVRAHLIGFVFQASHVLPQDTAAQNAAMGLRVQGIPLRKRRTRVSVALQRLGMLPRAGVLGKNLSGGERQRVAIARAIATGPRLILADEPTGALDAENSERIIEHLRELNDSGVTVIIITHNPDIAAAAQRRVSIIDGVLTEEFTSPQSEKSMPERSPSRERGSRLRGLGGALSRFGDEILQAVSTHSSKPGRTVLLLLAFLLGTGGLVASMGLSESAAAQVADRITAAGLDEVRVSFTDPTRTLDPAIAESITKLPGVLAVGLRGEASTVEMRPSLLPPNSVLGQPKFSGRVVIADSRYFTVAGVQTIPAHVGEQFNISRSGDTAILGEEAAAELGIANAEPGARIWVYGIPVEIAGIISDPGREELLANSIVLAPALTDRITAFTPALVVRTEIGFPAPLAEAIPPTVDPINPGSVKIETVADLRSLRRGVANDRGSLVAIIAWVLLALASLSAATSMYLSVQSRASEIALRRAIGASRASIWRVFTLEGLTIGLGGGVAGSAVGVGATVLACALQGWTPVLDPAILGWGVLAGGVTGILAATYPALIAARAQPADAIRG